MNDLEMLMLLKSSAGGAPLTEYTATGNPATFSTNVAKPLRKMDIPFTPVQDLHGYDYPWPVSGWKNLTKLTADKAGSNRNSTVTYSDSGATVTSTGTYGRYGWLIPVTIGQTYTISFKGQVSTDQSGMNPKVYFGSQDNTWGSGDEGYLGNVSIPLTESARSFTFTTTTDVLFFGVYVTSTATSGYVVIRNLQLELGSSATNYAPYSNICPISGWTGVNINVRNKNLLTSTGYAWKNGTGLKVDDTYAISSFDLISTAPGEKFTFYRNMTMAANQSIVTRVYDANREYIGNGTGMNATESGIKTITIPSNTYYVAFTQFGYLNTSGLDVQIERGDTFTGYEAPSGTAYPVTFSTPPGTVYSGTLTVNKDGTGKIVAEWVKGTYANVSQILDASTGTGKCINLTPAQTAVYSDGIITIIFDKVKSVTYASRGQAWSGYINATGKVVVFVPEDATASSVNYALSGMEYVYKLATPVTYNLTKEQVGQIQILVGDNNIWTDTNGTNTVKYLKRG